MNAFTVVVFIIAHAALICSVFVNHIWLLYTILMSSN